MKEFILVRSLAVRLSSALLLAFLALYATPPARAQSASGRDLYNQHCAFCHGVNGLAETPVGRILKPRPRRFADPVEMARLTDDQVYRAIKEGKPGTAMASWAQVLSEPQIGDVMDYIRHLASTAKPMSSEELSLEVGHRIYAKECAFCHGKNGEADTDAAKVLNPPPRNFSDPIEMARVDDGRLYAAIKLGLPGTGMASWSGLLSPVEIIDVMRYVRSLQKPLPPDMTAEKLDFVVGRNIYRQYCTYCHGENGDADTELGHVLVPPPRNFTDRVAMAKLSDEQMKVAISEGKPGTAMASWGGILDPHDIQRVSHYIRTQFAPKK